MNHCLAGPVLYQLGTQVGLLQKGLIWLLLLNQCLVVRGRVKCCTELL